MGSINSRNGRLFLDFRYRDKRCREYTKISDTAANRTQLSRFLERISAEITLGTFEYAQYFPNSKRVVWATSHRLSSTAPEDPQQPIFKDFAALWFVEMEPQWRNSHRKNIRQTLNKHLLPAFGDHLIGAIKKPEILGFRSRLVQLPGQANGSTLSPSRVNHTMTPLRMILNEAAERFNFPTPWHNIKPLTVPRSDVQPFSLPEVSLILENVRQDFRSYYCVRFFAGLRTAEIDGLPL